MSKEVEKLMHKVGLKLRKKPEAMQQFIDKLNDNWYDSIEAMKEIDADTWANTLKFPSRLVKVIIEELNLDNTKMGKQNSNKINYKIKN